MVNFNNSLKTIVIYFICSLSVSAYDMDTSKKDAKGNIVQNKLVVPIEKDIVVTGYGTTKEKALNNALKSAVEQYIGVVVDSETMLLNNKLIKNKVLTSTHGYVKKYDEISTNSKDGLVEIKIKALVESQKILKKIQSLNISTISVNYDTEDIYTRITTKNKSKKDSEVLLKKYYDDFCNIKCVHDILTIDPLKIKVLEEKIENNLVPVIVSFKLGIDEEIYANRVKYLEQNFKNIGGTLYSRYDFPRIKGNQLKVVNYDKMRKLSATDIGFIKKYGSGYKLDIWKFPKKWDDIYPFNSRKNGVYWKKHFNIILEFQDSESNVIRAFNISEGLNMLNVIDCMFNADVSTNRYYCGTSSRGPKIFSPFLMDRFSHYKSKTIEAEFTLTLDEMRNLKKVNIELEQK